MRGKSPFHYTTTYSHSDRSQSVHIASYRVGFRGSEPAASADPPPPSLLPVAAVTGTPGGAPDGHTKARRLRLAGRFGAAAGVSCRCRFWPRARVPRHSLHLSRRLPCSQISLLLHS
jgi:hypothetical protein